MTASDLIVPDSFARQAIGASDRAPSSEVTVDRAGSEAAQKPRATRQLARCLLSDYWMSLRLGS